MAIVKPGKGAAEFEGSLANWAPDGSAVLVVRVIGDKPHNFIVYLTTKEKDLGVGYGGIWTASS